MKRLVVLLLTVILLSCSLTSCLSSVFRVVIDPSPEDKVDFTHVSNEIVPEAVKASVRVEASFYGSVGTHMALNYSTQGSGVVFKSTVRCYFILTNRHVIAEDGRLLASCKVYDAYGDEHEATLIASDSDYDLAVLTIEREAGLELGVAPLADKNADRGDTLFSVGSPNGLNNLVTYGEAIAYTDLGEDKLDFPVLGHDAITDKGSSGGGLFNAEGRLVGINYAGGENAESEEKYSFAIPLERVVEFLTENDKLPDDYQEQTGE